MLDTGATPASSGLQCTYGFGVAKRAQMWHRSYTPITHCGWLMSSDWSKCWLLVGWLLLWQQVGWELKVQGWSQQGSCCWQSSARMMTQRSRRHTRVCECILIVHMMGNLLTSQFSDALRTEIIISNKRESQALSYLWSIWNLCFVESVKPETQLQ